MRSIFRVTGFLMIIYLISSCSPTVKVTTDYDRAATFTGYKTFSVYDLKSKGSVSQLNSDRIVNAIKANLISKGLTESASDPDLMINAITYLKDKQSVTANTNFYGYGGGMYRPYGYWGGGLNNVSANTTYNTFDYKDGTLVIDVVDNKTQKMVWQGIGNAEIDSAPKNPDEFISAAVTKILAGFPPK